MGEVKLSLVYSPPRGVVPETNLLSTAGKKKETNRLSHQGYI
jgi:hypothetical protein